MPIDYSKWKDIGGSSDEDETTHTPPPAGPVTDGYDRALLKTWILEQKCSSDETAHIISFVDAVDQSLGCATSPGGSGIKGAPLINFMKQQRMPRTAPIVAASAFSRTINLEKLEESTRNRTMKTILALTSALNALCACKEHGGAVRLFELLRTYNDTSQRFADLGYANAAVDAYQHAMATRQRQAVGKPAPAAAASATSAKRGVQKAATSREDATRSDAAVSAHSDAADVATCGSDNATGSAGAGADSMSSKTEPSANLTRKQRSLYFCCLALLLVILLVLGVAVLALVRFCVLYYRHHGLSGLMSNGTAPGSQDSISGPADGDRMEL